MSIYSGHRQRLRERAQTEGLQTFQPHEVLELLLMQIVPQKNVNPIAHGLIQRFGSVDAVLHAPVEELIKEEGIGETSAAWLKVVGELAQEYINCWHAPREVIHTAAEAIRYLRESRIVPDGSFRLVCMDVSGRVLHDSLLQPHTDGMPDRREMLHTALTYHAAQVLSAHYVFSTDTKEKEELFFRQARDLFSMVDIVHIDHIVVQSDSYCSINREETVRYEDVVKQTDEEKTANKG